MMPQTMMTEIQSSVSTYIDNTTTIGHQGGYTIMPSLTTCLGGQISGVSYGIKAVDG